MKSDGKHAQASIVAQKSDVLRAATDTPLTVGALEQALLRMFPVSDAEAWDRTGLLCGDPAHLVDRIAIALDPTAEAVRQARACGANVLLTHHPAFIDPPVRFGPSDAQARGAEAAIYQAIKDDVALISFHTTLDASIQAQQVLPSMLGLVRTGVLNALDSDPEKGYGQVCRADDAPTLEQLAATCTAVFGRIPRVWGRPQATMRCVVTATGSAGSLLSSCLDAAADCLVCGEVRYHDALAANEAGLSIIELGHDVSELPLCAVLAAACEQLGIGNDKITLLDQSGNWWTPEATRR